MTELNSDVMLAILAMDSYNRGYGSGVGGLDVDPGLTKIGSATITYDSTTVLGIVDTQRAGFYDIAYSDNGETIISYRGTDTTGAAALINDIVYGWTFGGGFSGADQVALGIKFYQAVTASTGAGTNWRNAAA